MKSMSLFLLITILCLALLYKVNGQQEYSFSQYAYNKLLINPAYAGNQEGLNLGLLSRFQWVGIQDAPITQALNVHGSVANRTNHNIGLGLVLAYDHIGITDQITALSTYCYRFITPQNLRVSIGLQAGVINYQAFNSRLDPRVSADPNVPIEDINSIIPQAGIGLYINNRDFFFGLSIPNVIPNSSLDGDQSFISYHGSLLFGYNFKVSQQKSRVETGYFYFQPSVLIRYAQGSPIVADVNLTFEFFDRFSLAVGYRSLSSLILLTRIRLTNKVALGYAYDFIVNDLGNFNNGSHEILLSISIFDEDKPEIRRRTNSRGVYHDFN